MFHIKRCLLLSYLNFLFLMKRVKGIKFCKIDWRWVIKMNFTVWVYLFMAWSIWYLLFRILLYNRIKFRETSKHLFVWPFEFIFNKDILSFWKNICLTIDSCHRCDPLVSLMIFSTFLLWKICKSDWILFLLVSDIIRSNQCILLALVFNNLIHSCNFFRWECLSENPSSTRFYPRLDLFWRRQSQIFVLRSTLLCLQS